MILAAGPRATHAEGSTPLEPGGHATDLPEGGVVARGQLLEVRHDAEAVAVLHRGTARTLEDVSTLGLGLALRLAGGKPLDLPARILLRTTTLVEYVLRAV